MWDADLEWTAGKVEENTSRCEDRMPGAGPLKSAAHALLGFHTIQAGITKQASRAGSVPYLQAHLWYPEG